MAMANMKTSDDSMMPQMGAPSGPMLCLNEDQVEALGLQANPPKPGTQLKFQAVAVVASRREYTDAAGGDGDGDIDVTLSLEIVGMEVSAGESVTGAADKLYGGDNG